MKLKKEIRASTASAAREGTKTGGLVSASMSGKSRGSKLLPVVKRSHSGSTYGETVNQINHIEEERRSRGIDNGEESRSDAESGDESEWGEANLTRRASDTENLMGGTRSKAWLSASNSQSRLGAASTSPTMNYSRVYESTRQGVVSSVLSEDGDDDVKVNFACLRMNVDFIQTHCSRITQGCLDSIYGVHVSLHMREDCIWEKELQKDARTTYMMVLTRGANQHRRRGWI